MSHLFTAAIPLTTLMTLIAILVAGLAWSRGKYRETSAAVWKDNADAQRQRAERLEARVIEQNQRIDVLEHKVLVLTELVTGTRAIEELGAHMDNRFDLLQMSLGTR